MKHQWLKTRDHLGDELMHCGNCGTGRKCGCPIRFTGWNTSHATDCALHLSAMPTCPPEAVHAVSLQSELNRLERDDHAVSAASAGLDGVYEHVQGRLPADQIAAIYNPEVPNE